jgi:hypothetical protein
VSYDVCGGSILFELSRCGVEGHDLQHGRQWVVLLWHYWSMSGTLGRSTYTYILWYIFSRRTTSHKCKHK